MKVLILSANREHFPEPVFPLGAAFLASSLAAEGAQTAFCDAGASRFPVAGLKRRISRFRPDLVAVSLRNIDNAAFPCTVSYLAWYRRLARTVRSRSSAPLVLGGSAFSIFPRELLSFLRADAGYAGDAEAFTPSILGRRWHAGECQEQRLESLENVGLRAESLSQFPRSRYRTIGIQTARGCPHRCIYCTYPLLEGRLLRKRPPPRVAEEIAMLRREWGIREFFIVDSTFNSSEEHMAAVLEELLWRKLDIRFTCYLQPTISEPELFRLLAAAGCVAVEFGTDSGSPEMLESLRKGFTAADIERSSQWCRKAGIDFCHSLAFGGPGEDRGTIKATMELMRRTAPRAVIAMTGLRIYPGTPLEARALREGLIAPDSSLLKPVFYFAGRDPIEGVRSVAAITEGERGWFFPGRRNWNRSLWPRLLRFGHRRGPLWFRL